jgi:hypothetical protein
MIQKEVEEGKLIADALIKTADNLISKLAENERMIEERKLTKAATDDILDQLTHVISGVLLEAKSGDPDPVKRVEKIIEVLTVITKNLESLKRSASDDLIRFISMQEGMRRALEAVRETGVAKTREIERVLRLSEADDPEARRRVGEHPETITAKRNAKSLKRERESSDT